MGEVTEGDEHTAAPEPLGHRLARWCRDPSILLPALVAVAATVLAAVVARHGALVTPDSVVYTSAAENWGNGRGVTMPFTTYTGDVAPLDAMRLGRSIPLTDYPPLVPIILGSPVALGVSVLAWARLLHVVLLGVSMLLLGRLAVKALGPSRWPWAVGIQIAVLLGPIEFRRFPFLMLYTSVLSEPLMYSFSLGALLALVVARERRSAWAFWVAVGLASGAAGCRFAGAATVLTVAVVALVEVAAPWRRRLVRAGAAMALGLVPWLAEVAVNQRRLGRAARALKPLDVGAIPGEMATGLSRILWPPSWSHGARTALTVALLAVLVADVAWALVQSRRADGEAGPDGDDLAAPAPGRGPVAWFQRLGDAATEPARTVLVVFVASYAVVFVGARAVTDRNIPLDGRMLDGVLGPLLIVLAVVLTLPPLRSALGVLGVVAGLAAFAVLAGPAQAGLGHLVRNGYRPDAARTDYLATFPRVLEGVPDDLPVFTNLPDAVRQTTGHTTYFVPCDTDYFAREPNPAYDQQVADLVRLVQQGEAALVLADDSNVRPGCLSGSTLPPGLEKQAQFFGGAAYGPAS